MGKQGSGKVLWHLNQLAELGNPNPLKEFKKLGQKNKAAFALKLRVDPEASFCTVSEESSVSGTRTTGVVEDWFGWAVGHQKRVGRPEDVILKVDYIGLFQGVLLGRSLTIVGMPHS